MAKLTDKNSYIIAYSCVMVVIVAFLLAFVSSSLKDRQEANVKLDKKKQVLAALNIRDLSDADAEAKYSEVVKDGDKAFEMNSASFKEGDIAVYQCEIDGEKKYVVSVYGAGLWGPIWGYVAVNADGNTIYGAYFNHEGETAGLGAEIKDSKAWQDLFKGKTIYAADGSVALKVLKSSEVKNPASEVDAVTGATLTSNGVSDMLQEGFEKYKELLKSSN
ncbi:MAG: NADH:ubiquinone reductase (Na(+)-transporting) subunit C [Prevotella sp.]|nr:NADH:ubiquinone reductase (Na(+)-transporting) subunit C [Candidatus Prevotella equi]